MAGMSPRTDPGADRDSGADRDLGAGSDQGVGTARSIRQRLAGVRADLTPAEARVVAVLLDDYPVAGLQPVVGLARAAGVSAPTVLRLLAKIGLGGYREMRDALTAELASGRGFSPLAGYPDLGRRADESMTDRAERVLVEGVAASLRGLDRDALGRAVAWLADGAAPVWVSGGKFSAVLATYLADYLQLLRPRVVDVPPTAGERERALLDVTAPATCVVFDYRRYQTDTLTFGLRAADAGARLILCTDPYLSPLADRADVVLTSVVNGPSPYDVLTPAFAVVETLVALVTERVGPAARARLERFERWQEEDNAAPSRRDGPSPGRRPDDRA
jgi:DNA-binding MurR/RpiR family transcriptional regulator